jgi:predicted NACHT family NTPase
MKRTGSRISKIIALVIIPFLVAVSIDFLTEITGGKIGDFLQKNFGISNKTLVFVLLGLLGLALSFQFYSSWVENDSEKTPAPTPEDKLKKLLAEFHSSLKKRYEKRYLGKLDGRFEITLEVSENWLSDKPKTHKFDAEAKISDAMDAINKAFTETGRLLIVGSPGSGKTVLLLKLAIEILKKADPEDGPFPVIFNLASWKNDFENFEDWLVDVLNSGNGLSKDFARELLREQKIILFLDGLDELARNESSEKASEIRANCMASLNLYLRMGRKAVICCRRDEFVEMFAGTSQDAPVSAKVEVLDLTEADIILALQEAGKDEKSRDAAKHIEDHMEKNPAFLNVLSTPFSISHSGRIQLFLKEKKTSRAI